MTTSCPRSAVKDLTTDSFPLSQKYIDLINTVDDVQVDFLEGTTASGKTTIGAGIKFMRMVSRSTRKQHIIASKTAGTAEKNILNQDNGILDIHQNAVYYGNGDSKDRMPHVKYEGKIIYVLGYDNRDKWENVLGSQFGCVYIDEINMADMEFLREISHRNEYLMGTLNPDDPALPVYNEFINRSRPYKKYTADVPEEIMEELLAIPPAAKWRYWFFTFRDNLSLSDEEIQRKVNAVPAGTKMYRNKILGLRGKATGLIFPNFNRKEHVVTAGWVKEQRKTGRIRFRKFSASLDTSYSSKSPDTIAMLFQGITTDRRVIVLDEKVYSNADLAEPLAPSDTAVKFVEFLERNRREWGFAKDTFIDSADQATITELRKYKRLHPCIYNFLDSYKGVLIMDRIKLMLGWIHQGCYLVADTCAGHIKELEQYSWKEDKDQPEDRNDHTINSGQYGWIPYRNLIGFEEE